MVAIAERVPPHFHTTSRLLVLLVLGSARALWGITVAPPAPGAPAGPPPPPTPGAEALTNVGPITPNATRGQISQMIYLVLPPR